VSEAQEETKVRSRITVWSVALGTSLAVAYFYLILLHSALSSGRDLFLLSSH
jgi:type VI protein secretion system component VasF